MKFTHSLSQLHAKKLCTNRRFVHSNTQAASTLHSTPDTPTTTPPQNGYDVVLSSGFLAFAQHSGFLQAATELNLPIKSIMGTSSGAMIGSMYSAGYTPKEIAAEFSRVPPIKRLQPCSHPVSGRGILSLEPVVRTLRTLLPPTFDLLQGDFACAVVDAHGNHVLVDQGSLPEAVAASAAVPFLFSRVHIPQARNGPFIDGGIRCRIGVDLWRSKKYTVGEQPRPAVVHLIGRSSPFSGNDETNDMNRQNIIVVNSPKSGSSLWDLSGFDQQFQLARDRSLPIVEQLMIQRQKASVS